MKYNICSYCQREYGIISRKGRPIFRTYDHIESLHASKSNHNRKGVSGKSIAQSQIANLISCCNECNELKGTKSINEFYRELESLLENKNGDDRKFYLTKDIVNTIKNSLTVLKTTETEPLVLQSTILIE